MDESANSSLAVSVSRVPDKSFTAKSSSDKPARTEVWTKAAYYYAGVLLDKTSPFFSRLIFYLLKCGSCYVILDIIPGSHTPPPSPPHPESRSLAGSRYGITVSICLGIFATARRIKKQKQTKHSNQDKQKTNKKSFFNRCQSTSRFVFISRPAKRVRPFNL